MALVTLEQKGSVGILTIDRPEALNALNSAVLAELDAAAEVQRGGVQAAQRDAGQQNAPAASAGAVAYSIDPNFDREIVAWDKEGRNGRKSGIARVQGRDKVEHGKI